MSATANPYFELQQQAISSMRRIHQICLALEAMQVLGSLFVLSMGYLARPLHLYASMIYFFLAFFAHAIVFYVLRSIGQNVREVHALSPQDAQGVNDWVVIMTSKLARNILPYFLVHAFALIAVVVFATMRGLNATQPASHWQGAFAVSALGLACLLRVVFALRTNTIALTSFVTAGGFTNEDFAELVEH